MSNIKTFVICLERKSKERCDKNFSSYKKVFTDVSRFSAIDLENIDFNNSNIVHPFAQMTIKNKMSQDLFFIEDKGAVGCSLSHIELWKKCLELNRPIIIIEDDININNKDVNILIDSINDIPENSDFASLMYIPVRTGDYKKYNKKWNKITGPIFSGTQMYYITPRGASILLKNALPVVTPIGKWIGINANLYIDFNAYMLKKKIYNLIKFIQDDFKSALSHTFSLKKFLPNYNWFYILILCIIVSLITIFIVRGKQCFRK